MATPNSKIFGIGLSKTGTTSLARALEILGYKTKDYPGVSRYRVGDLSSVDLDVIDAHDALTDTPIPSFYRELDKHYPGSKFILTHREAEGWLKSCKKQFTEAHAASQNEANKQLFMDLYDTVVFDDEKFRTGYDRFEKKVKAYFRDRPQDLLVIDVTAGEGWEKLCPFLGQSIPSIAFPKANVTQITWLKIEDVISIARQAGEVLQAAQRRLTSSNPLTLLWIALSGGREAASQRAVRKSRKVIEEGLGRLNRQIPILGRGTDAPPHSERSKWNHFWLIDPLDGEDAFLNGSQEYSVDIALIQDGRPFLGVVHSPRSSQTYSARVRKGAYIQTGQETPTRLGIDSSRALVGPPVSGSLAAYLCHVAANLECELTFNNYVHEAQVATAALICEVLHKRIEGCPSVTPLNFNTHDMGHSCIRIRVSASENLFEDDKTKPHD